MRKINFNSGWEVLTVDTSVYPEEPGKESKKITLPYDAMIHNRRSPDASGKACSGYFPSGSYIFRKTFFVSKEHLGNQVMLLFEGVYMNAKVTINGNFAGSHPYGFSPFLVNVTALLRYGEENTICVSVVTSRDCRWYSGCGIYRDVYLLVGNGVFIAPYGVKIMTPDPDRSVADIQAEVSICNKTALTKQLKLQLEVLDTNNVIVADDQAALTAFADAECVTHRHIYLRNPRLWSADSPVLYTLAVRLLDGDACIEEKKERFGIRKLQIDPCHGLRVNGERVKLRGVCFHHDNGILGAANFRDYEFLRVARAKACGANAIRSVHNPASPYLLEACDELGMYVMDEAFDMWTTPRFAYDYSLFFSQWWKEDLEAMVHRDFNHPSVIIYSIGNELTEVGKASGASLNRQMAATIRALDHNRFVLNCVNGMLALGDRLDEVLSDLPSEDGCIIKPKTSEINTMMTELFEKMPRISKHHLVGEMTEETFSDLDIAGYNYMTGRYQTDKDIYPNRVICGTESGIPDMGELWRVIVDNDNIIGDFTWSGAEYIGEAGICKYDYEMKETGSIYGIYPWYLANSGMYDLIGVKRDGAYFMEIAWGLTTKPHITVRRPERFGQAYTSSFWALSDAVANWTHPGFEGKPVIVEVFSSSDEVELLQNGESLGRKPCGIGHRMTAVFETTYCPGKLEAIAYSNGVEMGRDALITSGEAVRISVEASSLDVPADPSRMVFVTMWLADKDDQPNRSAKAKIFAEVKGPGVLFGFGSGDPMSEEDFDDSSRSTFDGYAVAAIRPTGEKGVITLMLQADGFEPVSLEILAH